MTGKHVRRYGAVNTDRLSNDGQIRGFEAAVLKCHTRRIKSKALLAAAGVGMLTCELGIFGISNLNGRQASILSSLPFFGSSADHAKFFKNQIVDHFESNAEDKTTLSALETWPQRYYESFEYFAGPGHPLFIIIGGEDSTDNGIIYPFITQNLAKTFQAYVLQAEHRFYGISQPLKGENVTNQDLAKLLTPEQAMADLVRLIRHKQKQLGCSINRSSESYCAIITVGGSYSGFLSAMMRFVYPDVVDISYAASAPLHLYAQTTPKGPGAYYNIVTQSAERASPGCASAVKQTLIDIVNDITAAEGEDHFRDVASKVGLCLDTIPEYITTNHVFSNEAIMLIEFTFADYNMDNYPPSNKTSMVQACKLFQNETLTYFEKVGLFYQGIAYDLEQEAATSKSESVPKYTKSLGSASCFDMATLLPPGPNSRISGADWSGPGQGNAGRMWEFQMCYKNIAILDSSEESMFPPRKRIMSWLAKYCQSRYDILPQPYALVEKWGFDDLVGNGASRILFTNGLNDMWSAGSILEDLSDSIVTVNMENGAHHSDLTQTVVKDTDDVKEAHAKITEILSDWLEEIKTEQSSMSL